MNRLDHDKVAFLAGMERPATVTESEHVITMDKLQECPDTESRSEAVRDFINAVSRRLAMSQGISKLSIRLEQHYYSDPISLSGPTFPRSSSSNVADVGTLEVNPPMGANIQMESLAIIECRLSGMGAPQHGYTLRDCRVKTLKLTGDARILLENCYIETLDLLAGSAVANIKIVGGAVLNIRSSSPGKNNPLTGDFWVKGVFFPTRAGEYGLSDAQMYRNLQHHLAALNNHHMAGLFHRLELLVERGRDTRANKFASHLYEAVSDFGTSFSRPLLFIAGLFFVSVVWIWLSDGAAVPRGLENELIAGWRVNFADDTVCARGAKAVYLAFQPIVHPLGLFGTKEVLVPKSWSLALWLNFQGLCSAILIALAIFGLRRRFRVRE